MEIYKRDEIESLIDWEKSCAYDGILPKYFGLVKISDQVYTMFSMANGVRYQIGYLYTLAKLF